MHRLLLVNDDDPCYIAKFTISTFNDFTNRIEGIDALTTLQMAVTLNPRYKRLTFTRRSKREAIWTALSNAFRAFYDRKQRAGRPTKEKISETVSPKRRKLTLLLSDSESQSSAYESDAVHSAESGVPRRSSHSRNRRPSHVVET